MSGLRVAVDTEGSGLYPDDGARISAVSCAWRDPSSGSIRAFAIPFDQGTAGVKGDYEGSLPCGEKVLPSNHTKRLARLAKEHGYDFVLSAPNRSLATWERLLTWLARQNLIMHHKKYDCLMFDAGLRNFEPATNWDLMPRVVADTQLRQKVIEPAHPSSLKPTAVRLHLGSEWGIKEGAEAAEQEALKPWKGPQNDPRFDLIPWSVLYPYSRTDAVLTLLLDEFQQSQLQDADDPSVQLLHRLITRQEALSRVLFYMEKRGVGFDTPWCLHQDKLLAKLESEAKDRVPFRPTYPGARKYFFGAPAEGGLGLLPFSDKRTSTGNGQVDEDVITRLVKLDTPGALEFQQLAEIASARAKWYSAYPRMVGSDGRLRTTFRQGTVVTGRLAAERWQAHALPHDHQLKFLLSHGIEPLRYGLVASPGTSLWEVDVSQAEIRVATSIARCSQMLRLIKTGVDSHSAAALLMFYPPGTSLPDAMADSSWSFNRGVPAKRCNLGILYGGGVQAIHAAILKHAGLDLDRDQISGWISDWRAAFPPFVQALDRYADTAARQGWVRLIDGQVRYFSEWDPVHKAFNAVIQNSVAVAIEKAMIAFDKAYPDMLLLQIHDSLVVEVPDSLVAEVIPFLRSTLVTAFERLFKPVPFEADVKPFGRDYYTKEAA